MEVIWQWRYVKTSFLIARLTLDDVDALIKIDFKN